MLLRRQVPLLIFPADRSVLHRQWAIHPVVLWSDNYCSLLPGEERQISATYSLLTESPNGRSRSVRDRHPLIELEGWNIEAIATANAIRGHEHGDIEGQ